MSRRAAPLFALLAVVWGMPYLLIKVAVDDVGPVGLTFVRLVLGALVLAPLAWRRGVLAGLRGRWRAVLALAVVEMVAPFVLIAMGEQRVSSSLAGILIAAMPLFVALLALRVTGAERVTGVRLAGLGWAWSGSSASYGSTWAAPARSSSGRC